MRMVGHCRHNLVDLNSGRIQASISYHFSTALGNLNQRTLVQHPYLIQCIHLATEGGNLQQPVHNTKSNQPK